MKKLYLFLTLLLAFVMGGHIMALDLPTGVMSVGDPETTLETGKWYFLYNQGTKKYIQEDANNALKQVTTPAGKDAASGAGYFVTLEDAGNGKYYIKTGLGHYYKSPSGSARGTGETVSSSWAMEIVGIEGAAGHFLLQVGAYNMVAPTDGSDIKGGSVKTANSIGDWVFYNVKTGDAGRQNGQQYWRLGVLQCQDGRCR